MPQAITDVLSFFKEFGNLINAALILFLGGLLVKILRAMLATKDAHIEVLRDQLRNAELFSAKNVKEQFEALQQWYERSIKNLEEEKRKAIQTSETDLRQKIEEEMRERREIMERYSTNTAHGRELPPQISPSDVVGSYRVVGHNPQMPDFSYFGELHIRMKGEVLVAEWSIGTLKQKHKGVGLVLQNAVAFEFIYENLRGRKATGVVLYTFVTSKVMRGHWTGFRVDKLGFEECRKLDGKSQQGGSTAFSDSASSSDES